MPPLVYNDLFEGSNFIMEGMITLTMKEQRRNDVIIRLISKTINTAQTKKLLCLSERQIKRIKKISF